MISPDKLRAHTHLQGCDTSIEPRHSHSLPHLEVDELLVLGSDDSWSCRRHFHQRMKRLDLVVVSVVRKIKSHFLAHKD